METPDLLQQLYQMASASPLKEICGLIIGNTEADLEIIPIINVAPAGNQFVMHKAQYFRALNKLKQEGKEIFAVFHSHPNGDCRPSKADEVACRRTKLNYLIVANNQYCWVNP